MILRSFWGIGDEDFLGKAVGGGVGSAEGLSLNVLYEENGWCFFEGNIGCVQATIGKQQPVSCLQL